MICIPATILWCFLRIHAKCFRFLQAGFNTEYYHSQHTLSLINILSNDWHPGLDPGLFGPNWFTMGLILWPMLHPWHGNGDSQYEGLQLTPAEARVFDKPLSVSPLVSDARKKATCWRIWALTVRINWIRHKPIRSYITMASSCSSVVLNDNWFSGDKNKWTSKISDWRWFKSHRWAMNLRVI